MKLKWDANKDERFWDKVLVDEEEDDCWWWIAAVNSSGYGCFAYKKNVIVTAHRISWALEKNLFKLPSSKYHVMHLCDNKLCVNPDHLELGTATDNLRMAIQRGMKKSIGDIVGRPILEKYCRHNHERTEENTIYKSKNGYRYPLCGICVRESNKKSKTRKRQREKREEQRGIRS